MQTSIVASITSLTCLLSVAQAQPNAKPRAPATGVVCNQGFASGNRLTYLEIDSHNAFAANVTIGGFDPAIVKKMFPEIAAKPTSTSLALALPTNACKYDESGTVLVACTAESAVNPTATLTYYKTPDEITIRRGITATNIKLEVTKGDGDKLALAISFDAKSRGKKIKYAFKQAFGMVKPRIEAGSMAGPAEGCAITAGVRVSELK